MTPEASFSAPASLRALYRQTRRLAVRTVKSMLLASGAYGGLRSWRCQSSLLVAMFHRVLPAGHLHWQSEIPDCTITDRVFASSLDLMCRFHEPVAARDVVAALSGGPSLPRHTVLITFDDGWIDTLTVAGPILAQRRIPSVVFIPPVIFDSRGPFWQERLTYSVATGRLGAKRLDALVAAVAVEPPPSSADARQALARAIPVLTGAPSSRRTAALEALAPELATDGTRHFLSRQDLPALLPLGIEVGAHGHSHNALTTVDDPGRELRQSRLELSELMGHEVRTMSLPQSRVTPAIGDLAFSAGFGAVFTGHRMVNRLQHGRPQSRLLGRHNIGPDFHPGRSSHEWFAGRYGAVDERLLVVK